MKVIRPGDKFNRWTLVAHHSAYILPKTGRVAGHNWLMRCECGTEKVNFLPNVTQGKSKSCGCWNVEVLGKSSVTHGMTGSKTYKIWAGMKRRCYNPHEKFYKHYGGRGILVCDSWRQSFEAFHSDMGECPDGFSIERKDVNGNYEPSNCVWLPEALQAQNTRVNKLTKDTAIAILKMRASGVHRLEIAAIHGVDKTMVDKICRGACWKNAKQEFDSVAA